MVIGDGIEVHSRVSIRGKRSRRTDGHACDVRCVEQNLRSVVHVHGRAGVERSVSVTLVGRGDDDPCLVVGGGHAERADVKPEPAGGVHVHDGRRDGIPVIGTGRHARCAPQDTAGGAVPGGRGLAPVGVDDGVYGERNRGGPLHGCPRFHVHAQRCRVHLLVGGKRNLGGVETDVDSTFVGPKRPTEVARTDGGFTCKVGIGILAVQHRVLNVGVSKGRNFTTCLESVGEGVIVVVGMVRVANRKAPS